VSTPPVSLLSFDFSHPARTFLPLRSLARSLVLFAHSVIICWFLFLEVNWFGSDVPLFLLFARMYPSKFGKPRRVSPVPEKEGFYIACGYVPFLLGHILRAATINLFPRTSGLFKKSLVPPLALACRRCLRCLPLLAMALRPPFPPAFS